MTRVSLEEITTLENEEKKRSLDADGRPRQIAIYEDDF